MSRRTRILALVLTLLAVSAVKLGEQLYRWYAFSEERVVLTSLRENLLDAGVELVLMQAQADTLRTRIEAEDSRLDELRRGIEAYGRYARGGSLPAHLYGTYRQDLERYNVKVEQRNAWFQEWRETIRRQDAAAERYNSLSDSMRVVADQIGEAFYRIPLPVEAAIERGAIPEPPQQPLPHSDES